MEQWQQQWFEQQQEQQQYQRSLTVSESLRPSLGQQEVQLQPSVIAVPIRASSSQWADDAKSESVPTQDYDLDYGTTGGEEYDSAELFDGDEVETRSSFNADDEIQETQVQVASSNVDTEDTVDGIDEDIPAEVLSAFGLTAGPALAIATTHHIVDSKAVHVPSNKIKPPPASPPAPAWKRYPHLLAPLSPPGKRIIMPEHQLPASPKPVENHRESYGLTAASVYARLQPSLRQHLNDTNSFYRQKVVPRPYKRRPISPPSSTVSPVIHTTERYVEDGLEGREEPVVNEEEEEGYQEEEEIEFIPDEVSSTEFDDSVDELKLMEQEQQERELDEELPNDDDSVNEKQEDDEEIVEENADEEQQPEAEPSPSPRQPKTTSTETTSSSSVIGLENETVKEPISVDPADIKNLLRSAGPLSLSEILQQKGLSLTELLKGGSKLAPVIGISNSGGTTSEISLTTTVTTTTTTESTTTSPATRPVVLPSVQPISLRELLKAKNITLQEVVQPSIIISSLRPTLKPGVKMPVPFSAARAKGLAGLVAPTNSPDSYADSSTDVAATSAPNHTTKSLSQLKPLIFGGGTAAATTTTPTTTNKKVINPIAGILVAYGEHIDIDDDQVTSTRPPSTGLVIKAKRPYMAGTMVGEYGQHSVADDEDESGEGQGNKTGLLIPKTVYGQQRPIATSRLTPAPPRK